MSSSGITVRSPSKQHDLDDVELGSSNNTASNRRTLKTKDSNIIELTPLVIADGDGSKRANNALSPRNAAISPDNSDGGRSNAVKSLIASGMYSGCSVGMVLVNKSLASRCVLLQSLVDCCVFSSFFG